MAFATAHRKRKNGVGALKPYSSSIKTGPGTAGGGMVGRPEGALPLGILTSVVDYVRGMGHRPNSCMVPFPLLDGSSAGQGELVLLIVPPLTQATGLDKPEPEESEDSD